MILKKKDALESSSKRAKSTLRDSREFAKRMITNDHEGNNVLGDGFEVSMAAVQELAAKIALNSE